MKDEKEIKQKLKDDYLFLRENNDIDYTARVSYESEINTLEWVLGIVNKL